jgi:hypothetical protein
MYQRKIASSAHFPPLAQPAFEVFRPKIGIFAIGIFAIGIFAIGIFAIGIFAIGLHELMSCLALL